MLQPFRVTTDQARILVTGGEGFVGRWLLRQLAIDLPGAEIVVGCRSQTPNDLAGASGIVALDVRDRDEVHRTIASLKPTGIVHLAAVASLAEARRDRHQAWAVNLGGTLNIAEAVLEHARDARLVFSGSAEVYGGSFTSSAEPLDEMTVLDPLSGYAATKAAADLLLGQMAGEGLRSVRMRPFNHTGPGQSEDFVIPAFAGQVARIEAGHQPPVMRTGNLEAKRDFLDVRDVVTGYVRALTMPDVKPGRVYNLSSGTPVRIGDILERLLADARVPIRVELDPTRLRASEIPVAVGSAERARAELGWERTVPFEQTIADVLADWRGRVAAGAPA